MRVQKGHHRTAPVGSFSREFPHSRETQMDAKQKREKSKECRVNAKWYNWLLVIIIITKAVFNSYSGYARPHGTY